MTSVKPEPISRMPPEATESVPSNGDPLTSSSVPPDETTKVAPAGNHHADGGAAGLDVLAQGWRR